LLVPQKVAEVIKIHILQVFMSEYYSSVGTSAVGIQIGSHKLVISVIDKNEHLKDVDFDLHSGHQLTRHKHMFPWIVVIVNSSIKCDKMTTVITFPNTNR
jgi:hypothetical protein